MLLRKARTSVLALLGAGVLVGCSSGAPASRPDGGTGGVPGPASGGAGGATAVDGSASVDSGNSDAAPTPASDAAPPPADVKQDTAPVCDKPAWAMGTMYETGDVVIFNNMPYIALAANPGYDPTISTFFWAPYPGCMPPPPPPPAPVTTCALLDKLMPNAETTFNAMFAAPFQGAVPLAAYSYSNFCDQLATPAAAGFAQSGDDTQDKREIAAFFANVAIETGYLIAVDERGHGANDHDYHGRGSLQITTLPIYQECGASLGIDLTNHPELGSQPQNVWRTGLWYWMAHSNPSVAAPSVCHQAIAQGDFGKTVRIINGACGSSGDRSAQYRKNCGLLQVDPGTGANCQ